MLNQAAIKALEKQLIAKQRKGGDLEEESRLVNNIGKEYEAEGDYRKALHFHHYDRQISSTLNDVEGILTAIQNMCIILCQQMNLHTTAKQLLMEALREAQRSNNMPLVFQTHMNLQKHHLQQCCLSFTTPPTTPIPIPTPSNFIRKSLLKDAKKHHSLGVEALLNWNQMMEAGILVKTAKRSKKLSSLQLQARICEAEMLIVAFQFEKSLQIIEDLLSLHDYKSPSLDSEQEQEEQVYLLLELKAKAIIGDGTDVLRYKQAIEHCYDKQKEILEKLLKDAEDVEDDDEKIERIERKKALLFLEYSRSFKRIGDHSMALRSVFMAKEYFSDTDFDHHQHQQQHYLKQCEELELTILNQQRLIRRGEPPINVKDRVAYLRSLDRPSDALSVLRSDGRGVCSAIRTKEDIILFLTCSLEARSTLSVVEYYNGFLAMLHGDDDDIRINIEGALLFFAICSLQNLPYQCTEEDGGEVLPPLSATKPSMEMVANVRDLYRKTGRMDLLAILVEWDPTTTTTTTTNTNTATNNKEERNLLLKNWKSLMESAPTKYVGILEELDSMDYFCNRKASKSVMSLVDGQFNMKSRSKAKKGVVFSYGRGGGGGCNSGGGRNSGKINGVGKSNKDSKRKGSSSSFSSSDDEMHDFIVKEKRKPPKKKQVILVDDDDDDDFIVDDNNIGGYISDSESSNSGIKGAFVDADEGAFDDSSSFVEYVPSESKRVLTAAATENIKNIIRINVVIGELVLLVPIDASLTIGQLQREIESRLKDDDDDDNDNDDNSNNSNDNKNNNSSKNNARTVKELSILPLDGNDRKPALLHPKDPIHLLLRDGQTVLVGLSDSDSDNGGGGVLKNILAVWERMMIIVMNDGHYSYKPPPLRDDLMCLVEEIGDCNNFNTSSSVNRNGNANANSDNGKILDFSFYENYNQSGEIDHQFVSLILASLLKDSSICTIVLSSCPALTDGNLECLQNIIGAGFEGMDFNYNCKIELRYVFVSNTLLEKVFGAFQMVYS